MIFPFLSYYYTDFSRTIESIFFGVVTYYRDRLREFVLIEVPSPAQCRYKISLWTPCTVILACDISYHTYPISYHAGFMAGENRGLSQP